MTAIVERTKQPVKYVCTDCGSEGVVKDGLIQFDNEAQDWVVVDNDVAGEAICRECEANETGNCDWGSEQTVIKEMKEPSHDI